MKQTEFEGCTYWGDPAFVFEIINTIEKPDTVKTKLGEGSFGIVYKIIHDGVPYAVKKIKKKNRKEFLNEINAVILSQQLIPEYVVPAIGATYCEGIHLTDYIIYKYIEGDNLTQIINMLLNTFYKKLSQIQGTATPNLSIKYKQGDPAYNLLKDNHKILSYLWCALEKANLALNNVGWSHTDIKPDNLYFHYDIVNGNIDLSSIKCYLIDFGAARKFNDKLDVVTPWYSACDQANNVEVCRLLDKNRMIRLNPSSSFSFSNIDKKSESEHLTPKFNAVSRNVIWLSDMVYPFGLEQYDEFKEPLCVEQSPAQLFGLLGPPPPPPRVNSPKPPPPYHARFDEMLKPFHAAHTDMPTLLQDFFGWLRLRARLYTNPDTDRKMVLAAFDRMIPRGGKRHTRSIKNRRQYSRRK